MTCYHQHQYFRNENINWFFSLLCVCICMFTMSEVGTISEVGSRHLPWFFSSLFIEARSLHWIWNSQIPTSLAVQFAPRIPSLPPKCWHYRRPPCLSGLGIQTWSLHSEHLIPRLSPQIFWLVLQGQVFTKYPTMVWNVWSSCLSILKQWIDVHCHTQLQKWVVWKIKNLGSTQEGYGEGILNQFS